MFGEPMSALVAGLVVWYEKKPSTKVEGTIRQSVSGELLLLIMVPNTVAALPTCTERLDGNMAATRGLGCAVKARRDIDRQIASLSRQLTPRAIRSLQMGAARRLLRCDNLDPDML
jgi:hypothetical protein